MSRHPRRRGNQSRRPAPSSAQPDPLAGAGGSQLSPWEELTMLSLAATAVAALATVATWHRVLGWLVDHQVLVAAEDEPLLELPAGQGIGLDLPRIAIAVAGLVLAVVCAVAAIRRLTAEEDDEPW